MGVGMLPSAAGRPSHMPLWNQATPTGPNPLMPYAPTPRTPVPESSNPGEAMPMPVSYNMQETACREERDLSIASSGNMRAENPVQQEWSASPDRPRAPIARMSPELKNLDEVNIVEQEFNEDAEEEEEEVNSDSDSNYEIVSCEPETMSECSSESSGTLSHEWDNDTTHADASDGVIHLQPTAEGRNSFNERAASGGVDVQNSLRISGSGKFHLGPQWQTPGANTARSDVGPEFGPASTWVECDPGLESDSEELDEILNSCGDEETNMASQSESSVNTGPQGRMSDSLRSLYQRHLDKIHGTVSQSFRSSRGRRETLTSSSTSSYNNTPPTFLYKNNFNPTAHAGEIEMNSDNSSDGNDDHVSCQDPAPVDLCMSGARQ
ncbi:hypothetical protein F4678DRAFT_486262 [Xylaria arbuscula]|nr:hypothetical protein F4678DRAFT_486262 [Xylaria arbuscula]